MKYDKLVRDKIPEVIIQNGGKPKTHIAEDDGEYWEKLKNKLLEEVEEFIESEEENEISDILEVLDAIYEFKKFDKNRIEKNKKEKMKKKGSFSKRIILEEVKD